MTAGEDAIGTEAAQHHWPDWRAVTRPDEAGPNVTVLHQSDTLKVLLVGLAAGQALPPHPGPAASFHFLEGEASVLVGDETVNVSAGATVVVPDGVQRSIHAVTNMAFLGNMGDPAAEK